jgi:hypothetical protein
MAVQLTNTFLKCCTPEGNKEIHVCMLQYIGRCVITKLAPNLERDMVWPMMTMAKIPMVSHTLSIASSMKAATLPEQ